MTTEQEAFAGELRDLREALLYVFDRVGQSALFEVGVDPNHYEDICPGATRAAKEGSGERLFRAEVP